jgi:hypothetical protein
MSTIQKGAELVRFLFVDRVEPDAKAAKMLGPERAEYLQEVAGRLQAVDDWTHGEIERVLRSLQDGSGHRLQGSSSSWGSQKGPSFDFVLVFPVARTIESRPHVHRGPPTR